MNWIEILRLIVQIWPLIEKILEMITNAEQRETTANELRQVAVNLISGNTSVSGPNEIVAALTKPLKSVIV